LRSYNASTAAAEYCGEPARRHKKEKMVNGLVLLHSN